MSGPPGQAVPVLPGVGSPPVSRLSLAVWCLRRVTLSSQAKWKSCCCFTTSRGLLSFIPVCTYQMFSGCFQGSRTVLRWYRCPDDRLSWGCTLLAPGGGAQAVGKWDPVVCGSRCQSAGRGGCRLVCPAGARGAHDGDEWEGFLLSCVLKQK